MYTIPRAEDKLHGDAALPDDNIRAVDFWRWAAGDLCEDYTKGFFAEWMVSRLLHLPLANCYRHEFADCDVLGPKGWRIEVKATAYWQSWRVLDENGQPLLEPRKPAALSKICFQVQPTLTVTATQRGLKPEYKAHVYVLCFQHEENLDLWNALNLAQWEFYYLIPEQLKQLPARIPVSRLRTIFKERYGASSGLTARELQDHIGRLFKTKPSN
jgi:hypothetical protein